MSKNLIEMITDELRYTEDQRQDAVITMLPSCLCSLANDVGCETISMIFNGDVLTLVAYKGKKYKHHAITLGEIEHIVDASILYKRAVAALREGLTG